MFRSVAALGGEASADAATSSLSTSENSVVVVLAVSDDAGGRGRDGVVVCTACGFAVLAIAPVGVEVVPSVAVVVVVAVLVTIVVFGSSGAEQHLSYVCTASKQALFPWLPLQHNSNGNWASKQLGSPP